MLKNNNSYLSVRLEQTFDKVRGHLIFIFILAGVATADVLFHELVPVNQIPLLHFMFESGSTIIMDFAPEVWLALLGLVLGTLIIVISIASQSTPKLIDLYIGDPASLLYIWFITSGAVHNIFLQLYTSTAQNSRETSIILNTYVMLPLSLLFAIPYVLYILRYTKTSNVIDKIFKDSLTLINRLSYSSNFSLLNKQNKVELYQQRLFESMNQLDDLLEYAAFKEPKGDIINKISGLVQAYIPIKRNLNPRFFLLSDTIRSDISFKTMTGQFEAIEASQTFYEQKAFRLFGNAYLKLIGRSDFDLAAMIAYELSECGRIAIENNDSALANTTLIRFNTLLRFGIKHGVRNAEPRNIYNTTFHYSEYINQLIAHKKTKLLKQSCGYMKFYGNEIYKHSKNEPTFTFLVDVFALEMKKTLERMHEANIEPEMQIEVLKMFLQLDNPTDFDREELGTKRLINDGVRVMQVALALFYLRHNEKEFALFIIKDIIEDDKYLGKELLSNAVESTCSRLEMSGPTFWEDTDRGNTNIYFSANKDEIPKFLKLFYEQLAVVKKN